MPIEVGRGVEDCATINVNMSGESADMLTLE